VAAWAVTAVEKNVWGVRSEGASRGEGVEGGRPKVNPWDCLTFTLFSSRDYFLSTAVSSTSLVPSRWNFILPQRTVHS
jgi:hypothetical protein